jgi:hypothetical protein
LNYLDGHAVGLLNFNDPIGPASPVQSTTIAGLIPG